MKIEEIIKRMNNLLSNEHNKLYDDWACIASHIIQLEADKLEAYKNIIKSEWQYDDDNCDFYCPYCEVSRGQEHKANCIVNKAVNYIKENS